MQVDCFEVFNCFEGTSPTCPPQVVGCTSDLVRYIPAAAATAVVSAAAATAVVPSNEGKKGTRKKKNWHEEDRLKPMDDIFCGMHAVTTSLHQMSCAYSSLLSLQVTP